MSLMYFFRLELTMDDGCKKEPCGVSTNCNMDQLQPKTTFERQNKLLLLPERTAHQCGPYFFFQVLNHRSPEGESELLCTRLRDALRPGKSSFLFAGFNSFVGEFCRVLQPEGLVALKYRFCFSGHGKTQPIVIV